jgi:hypothetical protein
MVQHIVHTVTEQYPVWQLSERIMVGHETDATLIALLFRDVLVGCNPAAVGQGTLQNGQRKAIVVDSDKSA